MRCAQRIAGTASAPAGARVSSRAVHRLVVHLPLILCALIFALVAPSTGPLHVLDSVGTGGYSSSSNLALQGHDGAPSSGSSFFLPVAYAASQGMGQQAAVGDGNIESGDEEMIMNASSDDSSSQEEAFQSASPSEDDAQTQQYSRYYRMGRGIDIDLAHVFSAECEESEYENAPELQRYFGAQSHDGHGSRGTAVAPEDDNVEVCHNL